MAAIKNRTMMEERSMKEVDLILKRFNAKNLDEIFPPIGHIYSVIVEELGVENPDFQGFIDKLNEYIEIGGDGYAKIRSKDEYLYSRTARKLYWYLKGEHPDIPQEKLDKIVKEAYGGYIY